MWSYVEENDCFCDLNWIAMPSEVSEPSEPTRTFIWVNYGDAQRILINVNCAYEILNNYLVTQCDIDEDVVFDLCDSSGKLLNINDPLSYTQVIQSIDGGGEYILVSIEGDRASDVKPLLENYDAKFPNLIEQIAQHLNDKNDRFSRRKVTRKTQQTKLATTTKRTKK
ncbi:hypothetical protein D915_009670 [Fasciola hepatica]|uniref:Uncharacterized protein n=1 Tax=Fasciola hepatica TaxID=6192 RepID=A0A4E0RD63_FASHE|nr:hypothetical protein D915_009670 [Fasciola hepatica]